MTNKARPTPAEINEANRKFWDRESKKFEDRMAKRPDDAKIATEVIKRRMEKLRTAFPQDGSRAIYAVESMEQIVEDLDDSHAAANARRSEAAAAKSSAARRSYTAARDKRIRAASEAGKRSADIALREHLSESQVNRILRRLRPA